jgi:hypothetical protein
VHVARAVPSLDVGDNQWSDFPGQVMAMLHDVDGTAQGVFAMAAESLAERMASVADQVQEWAVEALCRAGRSASWPECPEQATIARWAVAALTLRPVTLTRSASRIPNGCCMLGA